MNFLAQTFPNFYSFLIKDFLYSMSFHVTSLSFLLAFFFFFTLIILKIINSQVKYLQTIYFWFFIFLGISIGYMLVFVYWFYFVIEDDRQKDFTIEAWKDNFTKRNQYVDSLLTNKTLLSKTPEQIISLLGQPIQTPSNDEEKQIVEVADFFYSLKRREPILFRTSSQTNYLITDDKYLLIWFDKQRKVVNKYEIW